MVTFVELGNYGRLGNMLFQIATTISYAYKYNVPYCFPKWEYQNYFSVPEKWFVNREDIIYYSTYYEPSYTYSEIPFQDGCSLYGYFQSLKYFKYYENNIRNLLTPKYVEDLKEYCCVHVRRGDYLNYPDHHPIQPIQYYIDATKYIPSKKFLVFSDDTEWCVNNFKDDRFIINKTSSTIDDFRKMIGCSHFIIANSSFSWWSAWLARNEEKVIVSPKNWFGPALQNNPITDLIPNEWIAI